MRQCLSMPVALSLALSLVTSVAAPALAQSGPPHAWLFGAWTGGLFPVPANVPLQACLGQPTVIFTRDVVIRANITDLFYGQRAIQVARTNPGVTEFRFTPAVDEAAQSGAGLLGQSAPPAKIGFGCENPDVLHVRRVSENVIEFPGCADFPEPLVRCMPR